MVDNDGKNKPESKIEAALFSAGRPLSLEDITEITGLGQGPVRRAIKRLIKSYRNRDTSIEVSKVGARFIMQLKTGFDSSAVKVAPCEIPRRFLKTLALIAYHQPIKQSELKSMIGDKVYEHVRELQALGMVHARRFGPTKILITAKRFPEYFGIGTASREGVKKWIADKMGIKVAKTKVPIQQFEDIEEDLEAEAANCEEEPTLPIDLEEAVEAAEEE